MRIYGFGDFAEDLAHSRANWPAQWRKETQLARQTWQEKEVRRVKDAHKIGVIVLLSLLVFLFSLSQQASAPRDSSIQAANS